MTTWINDLERLKTLKDEGHLTAAEYEAAKAKVLESQNSDTSSNAAEDQPAEEPSDPEVSSLEDNLHILGVNMFKAGIISLGIMFAVVFLYQADAFGAVKKALGFNSISSAMANQCVGLGFGDKVMRPADVRFGAYVDAINKNIYGLDEAPNIKNEITWGSEGDFYVLTVTTTDELAGTKSVKKQSFQLSTGSGEFTNCGPDTLVMQRQVVNGIDNTQEGMQEMLVALAIAKGTDTAKAETPEDQEPSIEQASYEKAPVAEEQSYSFDSYPAEGYTGDLRYPSLAADTDWNELNAFEKANEEGINFAGHYSIYRFGCGSACEIVKAIDFKSGKIISVPSALQGYGHDLEYKANSNLILIKTDLYDGKDTCLFSDLVINNGRFETLSEERGQC